MRIEPGSFWQCVDEDSTEFRRYCVVKEANDHPDFNGDGDVVIVFADGSRLYTKVRRFVLRYVFIKSRPTKGGSQGGQPGRSV